MPVFLLCQFCVVCRFGGGGVIKVNADRSCREEKDCIFFYYAIQLFKGPLVLLNIAFIYAEMSDIIYIDNEN